MNGPVGVAQHFACEQHEIGLTFGDDRVGLMRIGDHADGGGGNSRFRADARGEGNLEAGADGDFGVGSETARGDVDEVDAAGAKQAGEGDGFVGRPAAIDPVGCGDSDEEREVSRPSAANCIDDLEQEVGAVFKAAAVGVGALVGERREELVEQIAVRGVDLDDVESCGVGALRGLGKGLNDGVDARLIEGLRGGVVGCEWNGAGGNWLPATVRGWNHMFSPCGGRGHGGLASGMGELNAGAYALAVDEVDDAPEARDVAVLVDAEVVGCNAAFGDDGGSFKDDEASSTLGAAAEMNEMPIGGEAIVGRVLAHRGDADAVGKGDRSKLKGRKERMAHACVGLYVVLGLHFNGCAGDGRDAEATRAGGMYGLSNGNTRRNRERK